MRENCNKIRENLFNYYSFLKQSPYVRPFLYQCISGFSSNIPFTFLNPVFYSHVQVDKISLNTAIDKVLNFYKKENKTIVSWWPFADSVFNEVKSTLEARGFEYVLGPYGMLANKNELKISYTVKDLRIKQVLTTEDLRLWAHSALQGFGLPSELDDSCFNLFSFVENNNSLTQWLGFLGEEPVGAAQVFISGDVAGIYWVSTIPKMRRLGIASAITSKAIQYALDNGVNVVILHATPMARNIYYNIGFREYLRMEHFSLNNTRIRNEFPLIIDNRKI